jgi:integrase
MGVKRYEADGRTWFRVSAWVYEGGRRRMKREGRIPTRELAEKLYKQWAADSVAGRWFDRGAEVKLTVSDAWDSYSAASARNDSHASDKSRAAHLVRHLGNRAAAALSQADVDAYRAKREGEPTKRRDKADPSKRTFPTPATLDREVELLKRMLGYAAKCGKLRENPLAGVALLRVPNVRDVVLSEEEFQERLSKLEKRSEWMRPVLLVAFDTGMRISEVLHLRRDRIDWKTGRLELLAGETKDEKPRIVYLSARALAALKEIPAHVRSKLVFWRVSGGRPVPRSLPRRGFKKAFGVGVNVHDLRHSFATGARKTGIPESVVMKMGGWKTQSVFKRYNLVDEADVREAQERLEERRAGGSRLDTRSDRQAADQPPSEPKSLEVTSG